MITITVNSAALDAALAKAQRKFDDLTELMAGIGQELETRILNRFETEKDPDGRPWEPWSEAYAANRPTDGNKTILDLYGDMRRSMSFKESKTNVLVGFGDEKSIKHEFGLGVPPRRMLFSDPEQQTLGQADEQAILKIIDRYVQLATET